MSTLLPTLDCNDCGACCFEQCSPPGYVAVVTGNEHLWPDEEDVERAKTLPPEALRLLLEAVAAASSDDSPCCWLDLVTNRCRFYEHRPNICRDFEPGSEGCRSWRDEYKVDVERIFTSYSERISDGQDSYS